MTAIWRPLVFLALILLTIPAAASALSLFPSTGDIPPAAGGNNSTVVLQHTYSLQEIVIPAHLWAFILLIGLAFLTISILIPDRGELITGLLALSFITFAWIQSTFLGATEVVATTLADGTLLIQPVTTIYGSHWLPWFLAIVFIVAFANVILAIGNFLRRPTEPIPRPDVMQ